MNFHAAKLSLLTLAGASIFAFAAPAAAQSFDDAQKSDIKEIVRELLSEEPEMVMNALNAYQAKQQEERARAAEQSLEKYAEYFNGDDLLTAGNPEGDVTIVEFFDYNCGYCKRAFDDLQSLINEDNNVRVVFEEFAILGPSSELKSRWAAAAHEQGKYFEFHTALMEAKGQLDEAALTKLGEDLGLDTAKLKADAKSDKVNDRITKAKEIARDLNISGTPAFIIGGKLYPGYLGEGGLKTRVEEIRAEKAE